MKTDGKKQKGVSERMHKSSRLRAAAWGCAGVLALSCVLWTGCAPKTPAPGTPHPSAEGIPDRVTAEEDKIAVFSQGSAEGFYASDGYKNGFPFDCYWKRDCVSFEDGAMQMSLRQEEDGSYSGSEYRSVGYFSYGYYSVSMKAVSCSGVISSFFTYTNHPWDEIDIEFLGKDTTGIQFNYYTNGVGGHEYYYRLGFDGSEDFHEYGFDWQKDSITWYVDGKAVYRATEDIPVADTQVMMNVWTGEGQVFTDWCGALDKDGLPVAAEYEWIGYRAA